MAPRYSTAFSYACLAGTTIYCGQASGGIALTFPCVSYGVVVLNSILGIWKYGNPDYGDSVEKPFRFTSLLQRILTFPCIVTELWLGYGLQPELAYAHIIAAVVPFACYLSGRECQDYIEMLLCINSISCAVGSCIHQNYYGIACAISFVFDYFCIREEGDFMDVPAPDMFNYGFCFVLFFASRAIGGGNIST